MIVFRTVPFPFHNRQCFSMHLSFNIFFYLNAFCFFLFFVFMVFFCNLHMTSANSGIKYILLYLKTIHNPTAGIPIYMDNYMQYIMHVSSCTC